MNIYVPIIIGSLSLLFFGLSVRYLITGRATLLVKPYGRFERSKEPGQYWMAVAVDVGTGLFLAMAALAAYWDFIAK